MINAINGVKQKMTGVILEFFRCQICGEVYMGRSKSSNCPSCGALGKYMVPIKEWTDENEGVGEISPISRENLMKALQLEVNNAPFYRDASAKAKTAELQGIFKGLGKIEAEHISVIRKLLKCEVPAPEPGREKATDDDLDNIRVAHEREIFAAGFYERAAVNAVEPRVKKVFTALSEIENDHIAVEGKMLDDRH